MTISTTELRAELGGLVGKDCWSVIAGAGTGSTVHIFFGAQVLRRQPMRNRMLSATENAYEGEFDLFVQSAWRLEQGLEVLCGSTDDDRNDGPMVDGLSRLTGKIILSVEMSEPVPDLTIRFNEGLCWRVFCDQTNLETNDDNYSFRRGDTILTVGARGRLAAEQRGAT